MMEGISKWSWSLLQSGKAIYGFDEGVRLARQMGFCPGAYRF
jgi:hypothetical protein